MQFKKLIMTKTFICLLLAALMCSCSVTQPVWDGTKEGVGTVVGTGEDLVVSVWGGGKDIVGSVVGAGEGAVIGAYDLVTGPFTDNEEDMRARRAQRAERRNSSTREE